MMKTLSWEEATAIFGDPFLDVNHEGTAAPAWEALNLRYALLPAPLPLSWIPSKAVKTFRCHRKLAPFFEEAFERIYERKEVWQTIGDFGGCYALRRQRGSKKPSMHSLGIAVDLDVADNHMGSGTADRIHPYVIECFEAEGFTWGGYFHGSRHDPQHFEFADPERLKA